MDYTGRPDLALPRINYGLSRVQNEANRRLLLLKAAHIMHVMGDYETSEQYYHEIISLSESLEYGGYREAAMAGIGSIITDRGQIDNAYKYLISGINICDPKYRLYCLLSLLRLLNFMGRFEEAVQYFDDYQAAEDDIFSNISNSLVLNNYLTETYIFLQDYTKAREKCEASLTAWESPYYGLSVSVNRLLILASEGRYDPAMYLFREIVHSMNFWEMHPSVLKPVIIKLIRAELLLGDVDGSLQYSTWLTKQYLTPIEFCSCYYLLGETCRLQGNAQDARNNYLQSLTPGVNTYHAQLAKQQLAAGGAQ